MEETTKKCSKCGETKMLAEYYKKKDGKLGVTARCIECSRVDQTEYRTAHADEHRKRNAEWRKLNPDGAAELRDRWRRNNPEKSRENDRNSRRKIRSFPRGKLNSAVSVGISSSLFRGSKSGRKWEILVGYSIDDLMAHLEKQFEPGMTWENYGRKGWHVDHIIPLAAHNYETPEDEDFRRAWSLRNLRPLWWIENIKKGAKLDSPFQPSLILRPANDNSEELDKKKSS